MSTFNVAKKRVTVAPTSATIGANSTVTLFTVPSGEYYKVAGFTASFSSSSIVYFLRRYGVDVDLTSLIDQNISNANMHLITLKHALDLKGGDIIRAQNTSILSTGAQTFDLVVGAETNTL